MLTTYEQVAATPGMCNVSARPVQWVNMLIGAASEAIKQYCKRDFELDAYTDILSGEYQRDLVLRQFPVWQGQTYLAESMNGLTLPQATIEVMSTAGFHPGTAGNPNARQPAVGLLTGVNRWTWVNYTGTTATTFTGCSGGVGTLALNPGSNPTAPISVYSPVLHFDPQARGGQSSTAFGPSTQLIGGVHYYVVTDIVGQGGETPLPLGVRASKRGLIRNEGGAGYFWQQGANYGGGGKLGGSRLPSWPFCDGGIRVMYTAGMLTIPFDLQYACVMMVMQMMRIQPSGTNLSSEGLGAYSYSALADGDNPEMGTIRRTLARYRESSWSMGS